MRVLWKVKSSIKLQGIVIIIIIISILLSFPKALRKQCIFCDLVGLLIGGYDIF